MTDTRTPAQRRAIMQAVKSKNTVPELTVRRMLHARGYRYRLHDKRLPGTPDICFPSRHKAIFVHGCFWHGHGCNKGRLPKSRSDYWAPKIEANRVRDGVKRDQLEALGWSVFTVWQCDLEDPERLELQLKIFLDPG
jgi:DNA mismatch endonuclease (patch repair protein)